MVSVAILVYPDSLKSAVYGLQEMFILANRVAGELGQQVAFEPQLIRFDEQGFNADEAILSQGFQVVILPPGQRSEFYREPPAALTDWIQQQADSKSLICSACAGSFILAATGLLNGRRATTHWGFESLFRQQHPEVTLDLDQIIVDEGSLVTAGGMMSWLDLGFEVISRFTEPGVVPLLGKYLVVDTGRRAQSFYRRFRPDLQHGDEVIVSAQEKIAEQFPALPSVAELAQQVHLGERTFLRRFEKATGLKPKNYMQRFAIQKACDLLEESRVPFETIARDVGYEDAGACRKLFVRIMGLTPGEFRQRFRE
ncbi:GlxA family transcriptional regulator [Oceanospirillum sanctuarii]|uniref:GlxA family transcriptional regulator n=1 Tax=Oceanospirillum sanctuarii TaxID=1434821 RepID=UPI001FE43B05|nr:helix-turn-helix domain-containing protein [Oceanospirillum sanctuarii]